MKISPTIRVVIGLVALTTSIILLAEFIGLVPDRRNDVMHGRQQFCESVAMSFSTLANRADLPTIRKYFDNVVKRNGDIRSLGLRKSDGTDMLEIGDHFSTWQFSEDTNSTETHMRVPVYGTDELWGTVEIQFEPIEPPGILGVFQSKKLVLVAFVAGVAFFAFFVYLRFVLRQLNPAKVIPGRVREALDCLAEGLLVMDKKERIVLANQAFQSSTGRNLDELLGRRAQSLPFFVCEHDESRPQKTAHPWLATLESGSKVQGKLMAIESIEQQSTTTFSVSCAPILDEKGQNRGAIASFEDVTQLERRNKELKDMVHRLDASTTEIKRQNRDLEILATRDPLTGCLNRRSFFQQFDAEFAKANRRSLPLSVLMIDIDHFKSINDNHGHSTGDEVLRLVSATLDMNSRKSDLVCRYGGEEFSMLLPGTNIDEASSIAEKIRFALQELEIGSVSITTSVGVSAMCQNPLSPQDLLEQADKSLYGAKRNGRNQVVRWDMFPKNIDPNETKPVTAREESEGDRSRIPFHAVSALISALAFRDQDTANHSRRVADFCVAVAEGLLPMRECYTLEIAGLLHDIGKIGVPDSILLKPEPLTDDEMQLVKMHQRIGTEIVNSSFDCAELDEIIENYQTPFGQDGEPSNKRLPIGARILAIADAYDSMTANQRYRKGISKPETFAELRRCAGEQFDPELVERFIDTLTIRGNVLSVDDEQVSKAAALDIGLQIERLSAVIDNLDTVGIGAIASRLEETANKYGVKSIAEKAKMISTVNDHDGELYEIIRYTNELLDLCRSSQRSMLWSELNT